MVPISIVCATVLVGFSGFFSRDFPGCRVVDAEFFESLGGQEFEPSSLCEQGFAEAFGNAPLADDLGKVGDGVRPPRYADVGMFAAVKDVVGYDALTVGLRELDRLGGRQFLFVEHGSEGRGFKDLLEDREFGLIQKRLNRLLVG